MQQYVTRKGDTVSRIAAAHGLNPEHVIHANPWVMKQAYLHTGQIIFLPSAPRRRYELQAGDRAEKVAALFNISIDELEKLNPGILSGRCHLGKVLVIPLSKTERVVGLRGEYGPSDVEKDIAALLEKYPFMEKDIIGYSVLGKPLYLIKIGRGARHLHVNAALHANEWLTSPCLLSFMEEYAAAYAGGNSWNGHNVQDWYDNWTLWAVPMVNPDGVELVQEGVDPEHIFFNELMKWNGGRRGFRHWKANIRGVDLGDQFPAHWEEETSRRGVKGPAPRDYSGPSPLSEPEADALAALAYKVQGRAAVSLHSQGGEIYWNYRGYEPSESAALAKRMASSSGYRAVELTDSDAGFKDWFIQTFRKPGFTVELGMGKNPLPLSDFEDMAHETGLIIGALLTDVKDK